jgi:hypothetical protein
MLQQFLSLPLAAQVLINAVTGDVESLGRDSSGLPTIRPLKVRAGPSQGVLEATT